jgi:hypothetical protein
MGAFRVMRMRARKTMGELVHPPLLCSRGETNRNLCLVAGVRSQKAESQLVSCHSALVSVVLC